MSGWMSYVGMGYRDGDDGASGHWQDTQYYAPQPTSESGVGS